MILKLTGKGLTIIFLEGGGGGGNEKLYVASPKTK